MITFAGYFICNHDLLVNKSTDSARLIRSYEQDVTSLCAFIFSKSNVTVKFVRGGHFGGSAVYDFLHAISPGLVIQNFENSAKYKIDLIVEGPPKFRKFSPCADETDIPWMQFIAEPGNAYAERDWCVHTQPALARLDTSFYHFNQTSIETVFAWTPYAQVIARQLGSSVLSDGFDWVSWRSRPHLMVWISSNCIKSRMRAFYVLHNYFRSNSFGEAHSLGRCANNRKTQLPPRSQGWMSVVHTYTDYRFALVIESQLEPGYVTEKAVTAISSGAIPIYLGDSKAARILFNGSTTPYLDVNTIWQIKNHSVKSGRPNRSDWLVVAKYVHEFDTDPERHANDLYEFAAKRAQLDDIHARMLKKFEVTSVAANCQKVS